LHSDPGTPDSLEQLFARGIELQRSGKHVEALDVLGRILDAEPGHPYAHQLAGVSALQLGRWDLGVAHSRVAAAANPRNAAAWCNMALGQRELGRRAQARFAAERATAADPGFAYSWIASGLVKQDAGARGEARADFDRALELDPDLASAHLALGNLDQEEGRVDAALESYRKARAIDASIAEVPYSLGHLFHKSTGDVPAAIASYREAIALRPDYAMAHHNLANALLLVGEFAQAWEEYRWRPPRLKLEARGNAAGHPYSPQRRTPPAGSRVLVLSEQGLGDVIFFLRFAQVLRQRGVRLDFQGDPRLHGMLSRTGIFDRIADEGADWGDIAVPAVLAGDLPLLFPESERNDAPAPLELIAEPSRLAAARERLAAAGPAPYIGLAWRAGTPKTGFAESLLKELPLDEFGGALKSVRATWISMQREPRAGESDALASSLGATVHDFSAVNEDLEDCLAFMAALDGFVGVSNTNVHLRGGCGLGGHVLVPFPYEWRWMTTGASRWFPSMHVYRQAAGGSWSEAFAQLSRDLG
jgi:tetratricopeptide (TPR) repeat protein